MFGRIPYPLRAALLAALYVAVARFGLMMDPVGGFATLVWPPTGISLAALLLGGVRLWPGVWLGAFAVNLWTGAPLLVAGGMAIGNTLEAVVGAFVLRRVPGFRGSLERVREVAALVVIGAGLATLVSATIGVASLWAGGVITQAGVVATFRAWWVGDAIGALVVAPLILTWAGRPRMPTRSVGLEAAALAAALLGLCALVFSTEIARASAFQQPYLLFPVLTWAAVRFGPRGAATATFAVTAMAVAMTAFGRGPFAHERLSEGLLYVQALLVFTATTFLAVAALSSQLAGQRRELETALSSMAFARQQAERASELKSNLLSVVSHELRTPLASLRLQLERAKSLGERVDRGELIDRMVGQVDRLEALVESLLQFARTQSGKLAIDVERFDLRSLLVDCVDELAPLADARGLAVRVDGSGVVLTSDPRLVRLIAVNLLGNAIKFTERGTVTAEIAGGDSGGCTLAVVDTGPGIPADQQVRIFEPFEQLAPVRHKHRPGFGLGLALVRELTLALGGTIELESEVGAGSRFTVRLPGLPLRAAVRSDPARSDPSSSG